MNRHGSALRWASGMRFGWKSLASSLLVATLIAAEIVAAPVDRSKQAQRGKKKPLPSIEARIPNYIAGAKWGTLGKDITRMQLPLAPDQSQEHLVAADVFRIERFAAEPDISVPLAMAWDAAGRLWLIESIDYPNDRAEHGAGHDRIKICYDTDRDGKADRFSIFADGLSIPTSLVFANGGVIVAQAPDMLFLKDTDGDGRADVRRVLFTGWGTDDTHAGPSNLRRGLDNWIWGTVGYAGFDGTVGGERHTFRQGIFRFRPDGSRLEVVGATSNNTWGLGLSEEGLVFASTANDQHSLYLAIPARYYEQVRGWHAPQVSSIADHAKIHPITEHVRQVDWHGRFTAAAGSALYTARAFPRRYWNRAALVAEPTGHLIHQCFLESVGAGFVSHDGRNLVASDDEWTAPIAAEVGPDGAVWWIDWYNFIVQHNPIPPGFRKGKGNAYVTPLRDKKHGRIYRVVYDGAQPRAWPDLVGAAPEQLVAALSHTNMFWRLTAQRLLVETPWPEATRRKIEAMLVARCRDGSVDAVGTNRGVLHSLWTLDGMGAFVSPAGDVMEVVRLALAHRAMGVRKAALEVLPVDRASSRAIVSQGLLDDSEPLVRLTALLRLGEMPASDEIGRQVFALLAKDANRRDRWLVDAATVAAARHAAGFIRAAVAEADVDDARATVLERVVAHWAAGADAGRRVELVTQLPEDAPRLAKAVLGGLLDGGPRGGRPRQQAIALTARQTGAIRRLLQRLPAETGERALRLVERWGAGEAFRQERAGVAEWLEGRVGDGGKSAEQRLRAAERLLALRDDDRSAAVLVGQIGPQAAPELVDGLLGVLARSTSPRVATAVLARWPQLTPRARRAAVALLLSRRAWCRALLDAIASQQLAAADLSIDARERLLHFPDRPLAERAARLLRDRRDRSTSDRRAIVERLAGIAQRAGDANAGHQVFVQHCAKCHKYRGEGATVGPDLTGFAVHPKAAILTEVLDPNRSVEGNYRQYSAITQDGRVLSGLLIAEGRQTIELLDTEAKSHVVRRRDIDELIASNRSVMPEGFERLPAEDLVNLLEFLTQGGRFAPLPLAKAATAVSTRGMFNSAEATEQRLVFRNWKPKQTAGIPFRLIDPGAEGVPNVVVLYSAQGTLTRHYPRAVEIPCGVAARAIHILGGVAGWGYPLGEVGSVSMIVRIHYADRKHEDHLLKNGLHIADYIRRVDVPESRFAFLLNGRQIRYVKIVPRRAEVIDRLELRKGSDDTAPIVMAVTAEQ